jgi:hypothetical protein
MSGVPFFCQWDLVPIDLPVEYRDLPWPRAGCAIACATMMLHYHGVEVSMGQMLKDALHGEAFDPVRFWRHSQIVGVLRRHGLNAYRRSWALLQGRDEQYLAGRAPTDDTDRELALVASQMLEEGIWRLRMLLDGAYPCIVSVNRENPGPGHQILLTGWRNGRFGYHDPGERDGADLAISLDAFLRVWKGTAILAGHAEGLAS